MNAYDLDGLTALYRLNHFRLGVCSRLADTRQLRRDASTLSPPASRVATYGQLAKLLSHPEMLEMMNGEHPPRAGWVCVNCEKLAYAIEYKFL